jgi:hypothetical protein
MDKSALLYSILSAILLESLHPVVYIELRYGNLSIQSTAGYKVNKIDKIIMLILLFFSPWHVSSIDHPQVVLWIDA